jgi:polyisoprenoid-binding protein YceI
MCKVSTIVALSAALVLAGCTGANSPRKTTGVVSGGVGNVPSAETTSPQAPSADTSQSPSLAGAGALTPDNTTITWVGTKKQGKHDGGFRTFAGTIKPANGDLTAATIAIDIDTTSLYADNPKLTNHLKSPDFFEVKKYPKASFVSTGIKADPKGDATHVIAGDLTLHGTTKPITIPVKAATTDALLTLNGTFTIDRTDFGIAYQPERVDKVVTIKVAAKVARK